jgi:hypothetical protein
VFDYPSQLKMHKSNKKCRDDEQNDGIKCEHCGNSFTYKGGLTIHQKEHCKVLKQKDVKNCDMVNNLEAHEGSTMNNNTLNNTVNINSNNNITQNFYIQLIPINEFRSENTEIFEDPYVMIYITLMGRESAFKKIINFLHFDEDYPENMNICAKKAKNVALMTDKKWYSQGFDKAYPVIFANCYDILFDCHRKLRPKLSPTFLKHCRKFLEDIDDEDKETLKEIKNHIREALYDNKHKNEFAQNDVTKVNQQEKKDTIIKLCKSYVEDMFSKNEEIFKMISDCCRYFYDNKIIMQTKKDMDELSKMIADRVSKIDPTNLEKMCEELKKPICGNYMLKIVKIETYTESKNNSFNHDEEDDNDSKGESDDDSDD